MRVSLLSLLVFAGCAAESSPTSAPSTSPPPRIAVVDLQRAVAESKAGLAARSRLKTQFDERQNALNAKQAELSKELKALDGARGKTTARRLEVMSQLNALQGRFITAQQELKDLEAAEMAPIMKQLREQLALLAIEKHLDAVLEVQAVPWLRPELDVTSELVKRIDQHSS